MSKSTVFKTLAIAAVAASLAALPAVAAQTAA